MAQEVHVHEVTVGAARASLDQTVDVGEGTPDSAPHATTHRVRRVGRVVTNHVKLLARHHPGVHRGLVARREAGVDITGDETFDGGFDKGEEPPGHAIGDAEGGGVDEFNHTGGGQGLGFFEARHGRRSVVVNPHVPPREFGREGSGVGEQAVGVAGGVAGVVGIPDDPLVRGRRAWRRGDG